MPSANSAGWAPRLDASDGGGVRERPPPVSMTRATSLDRGGSSRNAAAAGLRFGYTRCGGVSRPHHGADRRCSKLCLRRAPVGKVGGVWRPAPSTGNQPGGFAWPTPTIPRSSPTRSMPLIATPNGGDRQAFAVLVERYWDRLYRWLYHLTHNRHAAEDLIQEAFLKALAGLDSFREGSNFRAWLFRIAYNGFVNQHRKACPAARHLPGQVASGEGPAGAGDEPRGAAAAGPGRGPAARRIPGGLPPACGGRLVVPPRSPRSLGTTEETARWRVFKARQKLMDVLAPQLEQEKP